MKIHKITKRLGKTITNRETFSSLKVEDEIEVILEEGEDPIEADEKLFKMVEDRIARDLQRIRERKVKKDETDK